MSVFRKPSHYANGNTRDRQGRLVTCEHDSRRITRTEYDGTVTVLMDRFENKRLNSPNDVVVKTDDSVWFTDPPFGVLGNYGVAIVALATLVRVVLHPLNMLSMKSMRAMQMLQPEMERLKQKYKDDPKAMNAAVMALYKEHKVNPAGGCLPMLMQMPLFIALYNVLFNAIELRQAPFIGWMNDLSAPDLLVSIASFPIRLLPLLMLGTGLLQQRLTPTDPRQLPTMYMMNVVMLVFFYNLPSGLVLYWTVMNLLTALQQWMTMRHDHVPAASAAVEVEATRGRAGGSAKRRAAGRDRATDMARRIAEK